MAQLGVKNNSPHTRGVERGANQEKKEKHGDNQTGTQWDLGRPKAAM